jgi:plasmid stability protein
MRTTLEIDDDVLKELRAMARATHRSLGRVASELLRDGLQPAERGFREEEGIPVFDVPDDAPPISAEQVRAALEES